MANEEKDNVIYVSGSEETRRENARRKADRQKSRVTTFVIAAVLLIIVVVGIYVHLKIQTYKGIKVVSSVETVYDANANYAEFADNVLKYTPDGVSYINKNGEVVWTAGEDFKVPIADVCGNYAVVADKGGNLVAVYGVEGAISTVKMPYTICDVGVAKQGAFAVILESDSTNYIHMYDKTGQII
ncbi:MAG: hypothetical protein II492_05930, partial [Eubacterium sp.]|nr:hypothetical protein [Eubacterium sp.]